MNLNWKNLHLLSRIGIIVLVIGSFPFFLIMGLDTLGVLEAGNFAMGTGPLVMFTFWPSIFMIILGAILKRKEKKNSESSNV